MHPSHYIACGRSPTEPFPDFRPGVIPSLPVRACRLGLFPRRDHGCSSFSDSIPIDSLTLPCTPTHVESQPEPCTPTHAESPPTPRDEGTPPILDYSDFWPPSPDAEAAPERASPSEDSRPIFDYAPTTPPIAPACVSRVGLEVDLDDLFGESMRDQKKQRRV